jgi:hypothetical protein
MCVYNTRRRRWAGYHLRSHGSAPHQYGIPRPDYGPRAYDRFITVLNQVIRAIAAGEDLFMCRRAIDHLKYRPKIAFECELI